MAVIALPNYEPTILSRWAYRALLGRLADDTENEDDANTVRQAIALDGLHLDLLDRDQAVRLAGRLARVADELRLELLRTPSDDPRDLEFAEALGELEMWLHDLFE